MTFHDAVKLKGDDWATCAPVTLWQHARQTARDYLIMRGISPQRITTVSYGETRPKFDNNTKASRSKNRRAVLTVRVQQ